MNREQLLQLYELINATWKEQPRRSYQLLCLAGDLAAEVDGWIYCPEYTDLGEFLRG